MSAATTFGSALAHYRQRAGLSMRALSFRAALYHQAIMRYESGEKHPRRETVDALAEALDLDPLDADRLRLAAGYAPCDLVEIVAHGLKRLSDSDPRGPYALEAIQASWRLTLLGEGCSLNAICREVR